jgi:hypothetical protein
VISAPYSEATSEADCNSLLFGHYNWRSGNCLTRLCAFGPIFGSIRSAEGYRILLVITARYRTRRSDGFRRREKKRESTRSDQAPSMAKWASTALSICLSIPQGRDEAVAQEGGERRGPFWDHRSKVSVHTSHEVHSSLALAHPAREGRVLKRGWYG